MTVAYDVPRPNPQKRNILIQKLARAPWWLLLIALLITLFVIRFGDQYPYPVIWNAVKRGIWTTIWVSAVAYTIAVILGLIVALLRRATFPGPLILKKETGLLRKRRGVLAAISSSLRYVFNVTVYQLVTLYVEAVRGIPTLVLVYYMALAGIPKLIELGNNFGEWLTWLTITINVTGSTSFDITFQGIGGSLAGFQTRDFPNTHRAIIGLAISYSAFLSEVFRAGIDSIGTGQREAAASLGMTRWQQMRLIVLPQAIRIVIPPLANDFIAMLKESSLVALLGVEDITRQGQTYAASTFRFFESYNVVALTYLVLTLSLSMLVKLLEMYMYRGQKRD